MKKFFDKLNKTNAPCDKCNSGNMLPFYDKNDKLMYTCSIPECTNVVKSLKQRGPFTKKAVQ